MSKRNFRRSSFLRLLEPTHLVILTQLILHLHHHWVHLSLGGIHLADCLSGLHHLFGQDLAYICLSFLGCILNWSFHLCLFSLNGWMVHKRKRWQTRRVVYIFFFSFSNNITETATTLTSRNSKGSFNLWRF